MKTKPSYGDISYLSKYGQMRRGKLLVVKLIGGEVSLPFLATSTSLPRSSLCESSLNSQMSKVTVSLQGIHPLGLFAAALLILYSPVY